MTNSFDFTFRGGTASALVNGRIVLQPADPPAQIHVPADNYRVGLGAFSDSAETVIRYRNVQLREFH